jgi:thymidylate kinase
MGQLITIEGPDGSGKSTIIKRLSLDENIQVIKTPPEVFRKIRNKYDVPEVATIDRFNFYARGLRQSVNEINFLFSEGIDKVVVDRYTHSLGLYHDVMEPEVNYQEKVKRLSFPEPDLDLILIAPIEFLMGRIRQRENRTDRHLENNQNYIEKVLNKYMSLPKKPNRFFIDTAKHSIDEVLKICKQKMY